MSTRSMKAHILCKLLLSFPVDNLLYVTKHSDFDNAFSASFVHSECSKSIQFGGNVSNCNPRSAILVGEGNSHSFLKPIDKCHWIIPESGMNDLFLSTHLQLNSNVYVYTPALQVSEIYRIKQGPIRQNKLFQWNNLSNEFQKLTSQSYLSRRSDLSGTKISAATKPWSLMVEAVPDPQAPGGIYFKGPYHDVFRSIGLISNFTLIVTALDVEPFGIHSPDGQWSGVLGKIANKEYDISLAGHNIDLTKWEYFEMIHVLSVKGTAILNITPIKPIFGYQAYLTVFDFNTWACIFGLIVSAMLFSQLYFGSNLKFSTYFNLLLDQFFLQKFTLIALSKPSQRMFCLVLSLVGPILFIFYTAMLGSDFRAQPEIHKIETFEDILKFGYQLSVWENAHSARILEASPNPAVIALHQDIIYYHDYREAMMLLNTSKKIAAFVAEDCFRVPNLHRPEFKEFVVLPGGYVLPLGSEFVEIFSYLAIKAKENGILAFDMSATFGQRATIKDRIALEAVPISLHHLFIPFGALSIGVVMSVLIGLWEAKYKSFLGNFSSRGVNIIEVTR